MSDDELDRRVGGVLEALADELLGATDKLHLVDSDTSCEPAPDVDGDAPLDAFSSARSARQRSQGHARWVAAAVLVVLTLAATGFVIVNRRSATLDTPAPTDVHLLPTKVPPGFDLVSRSTAAVQDPTSGAVDTTAAMPTRQAWNLTERKSLGVTLTPPDRSGADVFSEPVEVGGRAAVLSAWPGAGQNLTIAWHDGARHDVSVSVDGVGRAEALALAGRVAARADSDQIDIDLPPGWASSPTFALSHRDVSAVRYRRGTDSSTIVLQLGIDRVGAEAMAHAGFFAEKVDTGSGAAIAGERNGASTAVATIGGVTIVAQALSAGPMKPGAPGPVSADDLVRLVRSVHPVSEEAWAAIPTVDHRVGPATGQEASGTTSIPLPPAVAALRWADGTTTMSESSGPRGLLLTLSKAGSNVAADGGDAASDHVDVAMVTGSETVLGGRTPDDTATVIAELNDGGTLSAVVGPSRYVTDQLWLVEAPPAKLRAVVARDDAGTVLWRAGLPVA